MEFFPKCRNVPNCLPTPQICFVEKTWPKRGHSQQHEEGWPARVAPRSPVWNGQHSRRRPERSHFSQLTLLDHCVRGRLLSELFCLCLKSLGPNFNPMATYILRNQPWKRRMIEYYHYYPRMNGPDTSFASIAAFGVQARYVGQRAEIIH